MDELQKLNLKCPNCPQKLDNDRELCIHYRHEHMVCDLICVECFTGFSNINALRRHGRTLHSSVHEVRYINAKNNCDAEDYAGYEVIINDDHIKCSLCSAFFKSTTMLLAHCVSSHENGFLTCSRCSIPFPSIHRLQEHSKKCRPNGLARNASNYQNAKIEAIFVSDKKCLVCAGIYASKEKAIRHYNESHLNVRYVCDTCQVPFNRIGNLHEHCNRAHSTVNESNPFKSNRAPEKSRAVSNFATSSSAAATIDRTENRSKPKKTPTPSQRHVPKHTANTNKSTAARNAMLEFNKKHCWTCDQHFRTTSDIRGHYAKAHKITVYTCSICDHGYLHATSLRKHRRSVHSNGTDSYNHRHSASVYQQPLKSVLKNAAETMILRNAKQLPQRPDPATFKGFSREDLRSAKLLHSVGHVENRENGQLQPKQQKTMENISKCTGEKIIPRNATEVTPQSIAVSTFSGIFKRCQPANTSFAVVLDDIHVSDFGRFNDTDQNDAIDANCDDISITTSSAVTTVQPSASNANGNASNMPHTSVANGASDDHVKMEYDSDVEIVDAYIIGTKRPSPTVVDHFDFSLDSDDDIRLTFYKPDDGGIEPIIKREFSTL